MTAAHNMIIHRSAGAKTLNLSVCIRRAVLPQGSDVACQAGKHPGGGLACGEGNGFWTSRSPRR